MSATAIVMSILVVLYVLALLALFLMPKEMRRGTACVLLFLAALVFAAPARFWPEGEKGLGFLNRSTIGLDIDLKGGATLKYRVETKDVERLVELQQEIDALERQAAAGTLSSAEDERLRNKKRDLALLEQQAREDVLEATIDVLQRRLDPDGLRGVRIQTLGGENLLQVTLPGFTPDETADYDRLITQQGVLLFAADRTNEDFARTAAFTEQQPKEAIDGRWPVSDFLPDTAGRPVKYAWFPGEPEKDAAPDAPPPYHLLEFPVDETETITGGDLIPESIRETVSGSLEADIVVAYEMKEERADAFGRLTGANIGKPLAIVLDDVVKSAPNIRDRITKRGQLTGFQADERRRIVKVLRAGSLKVKLVKETQNFVGPLAGEHSIQQGLQSIALGLAVTFVFMLIYYMAGGVVATCTLFFNLVLIVGLLNFFRVTLSLPGIAGLILTVGMAVDANILIFERVREERDRGVSLKSAIENGFQRAFWAIFDSNLTSLLTGLILYWIGYGPMRGFAVTLCIGIVCGMFSALVVSRTMMHYAFKRKWLREFKMLRLLKSPKVGFMRLIKVTLVISVALIAFGLYHAWERGVQNFGIDFRGGAQLHLRFAEPRTLAEIEAQVHGFSPQPGVFPYRRCEIQSATSALDLATDQGGAMEFILTNPGDQADDAVLDDFQDDMFRLFGDALVAAGFRPRLEVPAARVDAATPGLQIDLYFAADPGLAAAPLQEALRAALDQAVRAPYNAALTAAHAQLDQALAALDARLAALEAEQRAEGLTEERRQELALELAERRAERARRADERRPSMDLTVNPPSFDPEEALFRVPVTIRQVDFARQEYFVLTRAVENAAREVLARREPSLELTRARFATEHGGTLAARVEALAPIGLEALRRRLERDFLKAGELGAVRVIAQRGSDQASADFEVRLEQATFNSADDRTPHLLARRLERAVTKELEVQDSSVIGPVLGKNFIDPLGAAKLRDKAVWAMLAALAAIVVYIRYRFLQWRFGLAAVAALFHDVLFTVGIIAVLGVYGVVDVKFNLNEIAAILTIIGYSINDTIVVFDRIRENLARRDRPDLRTVLDQSINQTLARTILTSVTTWMAVLVFFLIGGPILQGFSLAMLIGIIVGTYSSIFIAAPLLAVGGEKLAREVQAELDRKKQEAREIELSSGA